MRTPLTLLNGSGCLKIPGNPLAWRIAVACLIAWTLQTGKPLPADESILSLVVSPTHEKPSNGPTQSLGEVRWIIPSSYRRIAAKWWTEQVEPLVEPLSGPDALTLPPPTTESLADALPTLNAGRQRVADLSTDIALPPGTLPQNVAADRAAIPLQHDDRRLVGQWSKTAQHWSATNLGYRPLYFEEVNLERYGYTCCRAFQPLISATRFFITIPALPYKMVLQHPRCQRYALGHYRPGSCAPWYWQRLPLQARAGLAEAGIVVGLIFLIP